MTILSKAKLHLEQELPFALYVIPNKKNICGLFQRDNSNHDFSGQSGFVFTSFDSVEKIVIPLFSSDFIEEEFSFTTNENSKVENNFLDDEKIQFQNIVQKAVNSIRQNDFEKVVLSRKISITKSINLIETFIKLVNRYPTAFRSFFYHPKVGCWMGATPEQLIKVEENHFETVSLAGTHQRENFKEWSPKEIHEQQIVTDYILDNLHKEVLSIKVSEPFTAEAGSLVHLKTIISGEVSSIENSKKIITKLHPTPAVCGFPKEKAVQFILDNEGYDRKFYAGYLGLWNAEESSANLFVNLRCLEVIENTINVYVGCGITVDSNPEKEFFETEYKSQIMKSIL